MWHFGQMWTRAETAFSRCLFVALTGVRSMATASSLLISVLQDGQRVLLAFGILGGFSFWRVEKYMPRLIDWAS